MSSDLLEMLDLDLLVGGLTVGDLVDLTATDEDFEVLGVLGIEDLLLGWFEHHGELARTFVVVDVGGADQTSHFLVVG